jgi:hypothetical protein
MADSETWLLAGQHQKKEEEVEGPVGHVWALDGLLLPGGFEGDRRIAAGALLVITALTIAMMSQGEIVTGEGLLSVSMLFDPSPATAILSLLAVLVEWSPDGLGLGVDCRHQFNGR